MYTRYIVDISSIQAKVLTQTQVSTIDSTRRTQGTGSVPWEPKVVSQHLGFVLTQVSTTHISTIDSIREPKVLSQYRVSIVDRSSISRRYIANTHTILTTHVPNYPKCLPESWRDLGAKRAPRATNKMQRSVTRLGHQVGSQYR